MDQSSPVGTILLLIIAATTYKGLRDPRYFDQNKFEVDAILIGREHKRLLTSGFLHVGWWHFAFNMIALTSFSWSLELLFGVWKFLLIYFASLLGGSCLALYVHRQHGDYSAVGASGAISGVIFSSILLFPTAPIHFVFLPPELGIPGWLFGLLFIAVSLFGIKRQADNIGHEAHLGGAITGVVTTLFFLPFSQINWWLVAALILPVALFLQLIAKNPAVLMLDHYWGEDVKRLQAPKKKPKPRLLESSNGRPINIKSEKQAELDAILDKIGRTGLDSLTKEERKRLDELTGEV